MSVRLVISEAVLLGHSLWIAPLTPADVRRFGEVRHSSGARSVVGLGGWEFDPTTQQLSVDLDKILVLNVGTSDEALLVDLGESAGETKKSNREQSGPRAGDQQFVVECGLLLDQAFADMAKQLLAEIRRRHRGHLHEGQARKWVNHPSNFVAITIQPRDQSLAVHVKGDPNEFNAPTLDIKPDRPSYSRFKLERAAQLPDAIRAILASAQRSEGFSAAE